MIRRAMLPRIKLSTRIFGIFIGEMGERKKKRRRRMARILVNF